MEKLGTIYKIENLVNGKVYIGQTIQKFEIRKYAHLYELKTGVKKNRKLQNAWNKYGENNFTFSIIVKCRAQELNSLEVKYISLYDSYNNGYNSTTGGQNNFNYTHGESTKQKISKINKKLWSDEQYRNKMLKRPIYSGSEAPRATKVICINDQKVFSSMFEAGEYYGIGMKKVSSCCTGKCEYTGLEETGKKLQFDYYKENKNYQLRNIIHCNEKKKIKCITTGQVFDSMNEAKSITGAHTASISYVCKGKRKHAGKLEDGTKLEWEYA